nr:dehydrodolichyl diphosphate synthase 2-like [Ipomoea batatas]
MWVLQFPTTHSFSNFTMASTQPPADGKRRFAATPTPTPTPTQRGLKVKYGRPTDIDMSEASPNNTSRRQLPEGLVPELMPKHVGFILDGNRRWAKEKGMMVELGHQFGSKKVKHLITLCQNWGIKVLSLFTFSTENWLRPKEEVGFLMRLFKQVIDTELEESRRAGVRISFIGDKSKLPRSVQELVQAAEEATKGNTNVHILVAMNYSGRSDILQACKRIARKVKDGDLEVEDIENEGMFDGELETRCAEFPNPDLLIRTSGELRISNFMLWQLAYTELFFVDKNFPDFQEDDFLQALRSFQQRHRRFGGHKY